MYEPQGSVFQRTYQSLRAALDGAFTVYYFVGDFPDNSEAYSTAPPLAGVNHVFAAPAEACDNCGFQQAAGLRVSNTQPITPILFDYMENQRLQSLHPRDVVPFLRANLHWRVVGVSLHFRLRHSTEAFCFCFPLP